MATKVQDGYVLEVYHSGKTYGEGFVVCMGTWILYRVTIGSKNIRHIDTYPDPEVMRAARRLIDRLLLGVR